MFPGAGNGEGGASGDPFAEIRGNSAEGSLFGGATWAICCAVCCLCALISLFIAYVIWAVLTIVTSEGAAETPCGETYNIWAFCLAVVIVMPLAGCILSLVANLGGVPQLMAIPPLINLGFCFWGFFMWMAIDTECMIFFETEYWDLTLLFKINVILLTFTFVLLCCALCLMGAMLGSGGMQGFAGGGKFGGDDADDQKDAELRNACGKPDVDEVVRLLQSGANHAARDKSTGNQALHYAAQAGRTEICKKLVEVGASIDDQNITGETPLALARGHPDTEEYLKSLGARADTSAAAAATQEYV